MPQLGLCASFALMGLILSALILFRMLRKAPHGYEDWRGFHYGPPPSMRDSREFGDEAGLPHINIDRDAA